LIPAEAGSYAMKGELQSHGFTYDPETGEWSGPLYHAKKMLGRDTSGLEERRLGESEEPTFGQRIKEKIRIPAINAARKIGMQDKVRRWFDKEYANYQKRTLGMNFRMRALGVSRKSGYLEKTGAVFDKLDDYQQKQMGISGNFQMRLIDIFKENKLEWNSDGPVEGKVKEWLRRPGHDDVREVWDVKEGRVASNDPRINKAAEELRLLMDEANELATKEGVHREDGSIYDVPNNPHYMPHETDWDMELTDSETGEIRTLSEVCDDKTLDDVAKLRYLEKERQRLKVGTGDAHRWLGELSRDRERRLKRPRNPNVTTKRTVNHPFYKKDIWALNKYFDQLGSAVALESTLGHDMGKVGSLIADVPSSALRKDLTENLKLYFEYQDWNTRVGRMYRFMQPFEVITKMSLSPISVAFHNVHAGQLGLKPWFVGNYRMFRHPKERMREKFYVGVVTPRMNPALIEGKNFGVAKEMLKATGFSDVYNWQRATVGEIAWAWMDLDVLSDLKAGGKRAETSRRLLKDRMLLSDDEINKAVANNRWDEESKWKAERVFANKVAFTEQPEQMPRMAKLSMSEGLGDAEKNLHAVAHAAYNLQSFQIKSYSGIKEWYFDEVFHHRNFRPLLPFFLLYPAAGFALMNLKAGVKHGAQKAFEGATGQSHTRDSWDNLLEDYRDLEKHPWSGALKICLDSLFIGMANDRMKMWTDIGMMAAEGEEKKLYKMMGYMATDELDRLVGSIYKDIFMAGSTVPKAADDTSKLKNPTVKKFGKNLEKESAKEAKRIAWPLGTIPKVNEWSGTKKIQPPPK
jgi:hypothetical protein